MVVGLPVEAEAVRAPQRERRVPHEVVAVVVVALASRDPGKRRGGGRRDRASWRVRETPECERRALHLRAPGVVREVPAGEPLAPVLRGVGHQLKSVVEALRPAVLRPRERDVRGVVLPQRRARARPLALEADPQVGVELERDRRAVGRRDRLVVAGPGVAPLGPLRSVVEDGLALQAELNQPLRAARRSDQDVVRLPIRRRPPLAMRALLHVVPRSDRERVADHEPAGAGLPGGLEDHAPGQVAARGGHLDVRRSDGKRPASRSRIAPRTLGESNCGRQSHSTFPLGATSAVTSRSERNA